MGLMKQSARFLRGGILVAMVGLCGACASTTPRSGSMSPAANARMTGANSESPNAAKVAADIKLASQARAQGMPVKLIVRNGQTLYCWNDSSIGSNIPSTKCVDREDLEQMLAARREDRERMQTMGAGVCTGAAAGCGP